MKWNKKVLAVAVLGASASLALAGCAGGSTGGGAVVSFTPEGSIEDELERIRGRGAEITGDVSEHAWGRILPFQDSEGNDLQFDGPPA
jgi:predicted enzyme related to lactoylglutathione lyase